MANIIEKAKDLAKQYGRGHGIRLVLTIGHDEINKNLNQLKEKYPQFDANPADPTKAKGKDKFLLTAYNLNPTSIKSTSTYGWGGVSSELKGRNTIYKAQQHIKRNNTQTLELSGIIYPNVLTWLGEGLNELLGKEQDAINDLKNLKILAENGIWMLVTDYDSDTYTSTSHDYWFIRSIEHTSEEFIYNNRPLKLNYTMNLERQVDLSDEAPVIPSTKPTT